MTTRTIIMMKERTDEILESTLMLLQARQWPSDAPGWAVARYMYRPGMRGPQIPEKIIKSLFFFGMEAKKEQIKSLTIGTS